jgi:hypothetical protein
MVARPTPRENDMASVSCKLKVNPTAAHNFIRTMQRLFASRRWKSWELRGLCEPCVICRTVGRVKYGLSCRSPGSPRLYACHPRPVNGYPRPSRRASPGRPRPGGNPIVHPKALVQTANGFLKSAGTVQRGTQGSRVASSNARRNAPTGMRGCGYFPHSRRGVGPVAPPEVSTCS